MAKLSGKRAVGVSREKLRKAAERPVADETATKSSAPSDKNLITIPRPAARLQGGPKDGWVYFVEDLQAEQRIAERMGMTFPYAPTKAKCTLPWTGGIEGIIWRYHADLARPARVEVSGPPRCTRLGCEAKAVRKLTQSVGGGSWFGCTDHYPALEKSMAIGMSGATTGAAWIISERVR